MGKNVLSSSIVAALLISLLQPAAMANAVDSTITKEFTITDSNGDPYSGVNVALLSYDQDLDTTILSAVATTDVFGRAEITVPADSDYYGWSAQPGVGDLTHALYTDYNLAAGESEEIAVSLVEANLSVSLFNSNGTTPASAGSYILYPASEQNPDGERYRITIRTGAFGIDLSPRLLPGEDFEITIEPSIFTTQFSARYGLRTENVGGSVSYSVYQDTTYTSTLTPAALGVYELSFKSPNFSGQLRSSTGGALTLPTGVRANVEIFKAKLDGTVDFQESAASATPVGRDGLFSSRIFTLEDGKYFPRVITSGSLSLSSFLADPFWIVGGVYSATEPVSGAGSGSLPYITRFPATPNLKIEAVTPGGAAANETYIQINERSEDSQTDNWWGYSASSNGLSSFDLPDGTYEIFLEPSDSGLIRQNFELMVDDGVAIVTTMSGDLVSPDSSGVFELSLVTPNLKVKVVDPTDADVLLRNVSVEAHPLAGEGYEPGFYGFADSGTTGLQVPDGSYRLSVSPQNGLLAAKDYGLVVSGNGASVVVTDYAINQVVTPDPDGFFVLEANVPNITGTVFEKIGSEFIEFRAKNQKWAQARISRLVGEDDEAYWSYVTSAHVGPNGQFAAYASEPGDYRIYVDVAGSPNALGTEFGVFTISDVEIATPNFVKNFPQLELRPPAFQVSVRQPGMIQDLEYADVEVIGEENQEWFNTGQSGLASVAIDGPGEYTLRVRPPSSISSAVAAPKEYLLTAATVDAERDLMTFTVTDPRTNSEIEVAGGKFVLPLATPNLTGKIRGSSGQAFDSQLGHYAQIEVQELVSGNWEWTQIYTDVFTDGSFGLDLEDGTYRLRITPYGLENSSTTRTSQFVISGSTVVELGTFNLSEPTASFVVRAADSSTNLRFLGIEVRKDGEWFDWLNVGDDGLAKFSATDVGEYEFVTRPNNDTPNSVSRTYTGNVTLDGDGKYVLSMSNDVEVSASSFVLRLGTPNVKGAVQDSQGNPVVPEDDDWVYIQVQRYIAQDDRWEWTRYSSNVISDGSFALGIEEPGTYRLRIEAGGRTDVSLTFSEVFEFTEESDLDEVLDLGSIEMNAPTLVGQVLNPDGSNSANAMVIAINQATGNEMWDYSAYADSTGRWSMMLPEGNYSLVARPAWRDSTKGNSAPLDGVSVNSAGVATISGDIEPDDVILELREPTWSGTVVSPTDNDDALADVSVCLYTRDDGRGVSTCAQTDAEGRWGLSTPIGFTEFDDESTLTIRENRSPQFAEARFVGKEAIEQALDMEAIADGAPFEFRDIVLSPLAPNAIFTITDGEGGAPSPNTWVSIQADNQWLGGSTTNQLGQVKLFIPTDIEDESFMVEVQPNSISTYTGVRQSFPSSSILELTPGDSFAATIALGVPNFQGFLLKPGGGSVRDGWVDAYNETLNIWSGGRQTNAQGTFSLRLDAPEAPSAEPYLYRITAHPSWSDNSSLFSRVTYFAEVSAGDGSDPVVRLFATRAALTADTPVIEPEINEVSGDSIYTLELRSPTVTGTVLRPGATGQVVRDSFVVPIDVENNRSHLWELGQHSRVNGSFGLALEDGTYQIFANAPGELSNFTRSALCDISVTGGLMSSTDSDCATAEGIKLTLREPNLMFDLVTEQGDPVAAAHVGVSVGSWHGWSQSSPEGTVSLLIDTEEIKQSNPDWISGDLDIRFNVQAPYGNTDVVSWQCMAGDAQPLCEDLAGSLSKVSFTGQYAGKNFTNPVVFQTPNTTVVATNYSGDVVRGAWVTLTVEEEVNFGGTTYEVTRYIGSGSTTDAGVAVFYVAPEDQDKTFQVSVHAPWELRLTQVQKTYTNVAYSELVETNRTFQLGAPNLTIRVRQADTSATAARWSSVWVEQVNDVNFSYERWVIGIGTDESGVVPISLENGTYRITANPGPGSKGARTTCTVSVTDDVVTEVEGRCSDGDITGSTLTIGLSPGNFRGSVFLGSGSSTPATGAIVFAQAYVLGTTDFGDPNNLVDLKQESVVDSTGSYGLELDPGYTWRVSVFYVNLPGAVVSYSSITGNDAHTVDGLGTPPDIEVFNLGATS